MITASVLLGRPSSAGDWKPHKRQRTALKIRTCVSIGAVLMKSRIAALGKIFLLFALTIVLIRAQGRDPRLTKTVRPNNQDNQAQQLNEEQTNEVGQLVRQVITLSLDHRYAEAVPLAERTLVILEKALGPEHALVVAALHRLASLHQAQGHFEKARQLHQRGLEIAKKIFGLAHPNVAKSLNSLAGLYKEQGDYGQALALYQQALEIRENALGLTHLEVVQSLNNLAELYSNQGDFRRATPLYQRVLTVAEKASWSENYPYLTSALTRLGLLHHAQGDYGQAVSFQQRAAEESEKTRTWLLNTMGSDREKQTYLIAGEPYVAVSLHALRVPQNADAARLALNVILRYKARALDALADQIAALRNRARPEDQKLVNQLVAVQSQLAKFQLSGGEKLSPAAWQAEVSRLSAEEERLEESISRHVAEFRAVTQPISIDAVRQALPADTALVELFVYQPFNTRVTGTEQNNATVRYVTYYDTPRYIAYVLRHTDAAPHFVELGDAASLDGEVERLRAALKDPRRTDVKTVARAVDERVMRPIRKLLGSVRHIFLSPDGALNLIPFAALVDENGRYLVEDYSLTYLTSGRDLLRLQTQSKSRSAPLVMADPLFDTGASRSRAAGHRVNERTSESEDNLRSIDFALRDYPPLPGTVEEATALAKLMPNLQVLMQSKATESALKRVRSPRILHIATHGFFLADQPQVFPEVNRLFRGTFDSLDTSPLPARWENPLLRSGLILAGVKQQQSGAGEDGVLTALEVAGLDLWGTKLVVLSACETGLGDVRNGAGVYGLRRALVLAGSQSQVMSLWKVSDTGTRDLMTDYYKRLQAGEGRTEALRQAQLAMLQESMYATGSGGKRETSDTREKAASKDYRHPYYWAAFIQSGDWRNIDSEERPVQ
jgi:CHAT domain-containing protein